MRVPTPNVSVVDLTVFVDKPATRDAVTAALKAAAKRPMKGILGYTKKTLVFRRLQGNSNSSIVDAEYTKVVGDRCVKVLAWYDNEWATPAVAATSSSSWRASSNCEADFGLPRIFHQSPITIHGVTGP